MLCLREDLSSQKPVYFALTQERFYLTNSELQRSYFSRENHRNCTGKDQGKKNTDVWLSGVSTYLGVYTESAWWFLLYVLVIRSCLSLCCYHRFGFHWESGVEKTLVNHNKAIFSQSSSIIINICLSNHLTERHTLIKTDYKNLQRSSRRWLWRGKSGHLCPKDGCGWMDVDG